MLFRRNSGENATMLHTSIQLYLLNFSQYMSQCVPGYVQLRYIASQGHPGHLQGHTNAYGINQCGSDTISVKTGPCHATLFNSTCSNGLNICLSVSQKTCTYGILPARAILDTYRGLRVHTVQIGAISMRFRLGFLAITRPKIDLTLIFWYQIFGTDVTINLPPQLTP